MKHRWISLLLVLVMALSLFPAAAFAADGEETSNVNPATGREAGPAGDQRVALMVYGKSVTDALTTAGYSFDAFMAAVASEAQGVLANEKIPDVEVYLVNDANQEYKLEPSDGGDAYTKDPSFLKSCLIYTCLSNQNKCLTFDGSDGRHYQNELCFDGLNKAGGVIPEDTATLALKDLRKYALDPKTTLDDDEKELMELWFRILREAQQTANYNTDFTYGVYQISKELDTYREEGSGRKKTRVYDYPALHGDLDTLRVKLKEYYKSHITDKMFEYELLK